jgi:predicted PurR-regulated permease PerM
MTATLTLKQFIGRVVLVIAAVAIALFLWQIADILLLTFAGLLVAVFLRTLVRLLQRLVPLSEGLAFALVVLLLILCGGAIGWYLAPQLSQDFNQLFTNVPAALRQLGSQLAHYGWAQELIDRMSSVTQLVPSSGTLFTRITGTFSTAFNVLTNLIFVLFTGLFLAANPGMYRDGILRLVPAARRSRLHDVINEVVITLRRWLLGQFFSMVVIGSLTGLALWLLGMPFALALGTLAGLLEFVPYVGPLVTGVLAGLLAFVESPIQALYVILSYIAIQQFESNLLTPIVHRYTVALPPVLSLTAVLALGALFGFIGVLVATPLVAVLIVLVKMIYLEEVLGEVPDLPRRLLK